MNHRIILYNIPYIIYTHIHDISYIYNSYITCIYIYIHIISHIYDIYIYTVCEIHVTCISN